MTSSYAKGRDVSWSDMPAGMGFYAEGKDVPVSQMPQGMAFDQKSGSDLSNITRLAGNVGALFG